MQTEEFTTIDLGLLMLSEPITEAPECEDEFGEFAMVFDEDVASFDASVFFDDARQMAAASQMDADTFLGAWFAQQVESPAAARARRKAAAAANDCQLQLFA